MNWAVVAPNKPPVTIDLLVKPVGRVAPWQVTHMEAGEFWISKDNVLAMNAKFPQPLHVLPNAYTRSPSAIPHSPAANPSKPSAAVPESEPRLDSEIVTKLVSQWINTNTKFKDLDIKLSERHVEMTDPENASVDLAGTWQQDSAGGHLHVILVLHRDQKGWQVARAIEDRSTSTLP